MKKVVVLVFIAMLVVLLACAPGARKAAEPKAPYKVGMTAAMTGPGAAGQLTSTEGLRIYINTLNAKGGIDGHPIEVIYEDDRAEGARAVANVKKFVSLGVDLIVVDSLSAVYAGVIGEAKKANIPVLVFCIAPEEAAPPKPEPLVFAAGHAGRAAVGPVAQAYIVNVLAGGKPVKLAELTADLPIARKSGERMLQEAKKYGMQTVEEIVPMSMLDLTPIASKFIAWGADYLTYMGPGAPLDLITDALLKLGYKGTIIAYVVASSFEQSMGEKWKGIPNIVAGVQTVPAMLSLPEHKPILEAAKTYSITVPVDHKVVDGWLNGQTVEAIFKKAGYPVNTEKLLAVMNNFEFDARPLSAPRKWTAQDHIGDRWIMHYVWKEGRLVPPVEKSWVGVSATGEILGAVKSLKDIK